MTIAELLKKPFLTAGEMKRLGKRVHYFKSTEATDKFMDKNGGTVYTGLHSSTDWSKTRWWDKGWHIVNRTKEYAVVIK
jgi:hypothetical protein